MGTLLAEVAALGLAVAFTSPVSVVTVIVLLSMPAGRRRALAFVGGWLVAIAVIGALTVFVLQGQDFGSRSSTPSRAASATSSSCWPSPSRIRPPPRSQCASTPR